MAEAPFDALVAALGWLDEGRDVALATVTRTWGSSPRPAGSQMAIRADGVFADSVSGGCVEGAIIREAQAALADGKVRNLTFGVANEDAWSVGLACGGTIEIHVAPFAGIRRESLAAIGKALEEKRAVVLAVERATGDLRIVFPDASEGDPLAEAARNAVERDESAAVDIAGQTWFLTVFNPPPDLVLIGAVHIAQPLAAMAKLAGYQVRIIDPRAQFATAARFAEAALDHRWPDEALGQTPPGPRSAIVVLAHDPKLDDPALAAALRSSAFYIGALGSKQTHARRLERLAALGFSAAQLARIKGPVGLPIGARSPAEIAIAILAEITRNLRKP